MKRVKYVNAIQMYTGTLDTQEEAQASRKRLVSRTRKGMAGHQMYSMKMHDGPWAEGATANRELMKTAQREAHAIENAARHPENASAELLAKVSMWQKRYAEYKATKNPGERQYATLYTYTYSHLYRELKAGRVLNELAELKAHKEETYRTVVQQIESLVSDETDSVANMANVAAVLHQTFRFWWTGFYRVEGNQLVLAPFQGPIACTRIPFGRGVCGTAWEQNRTIVVPDVHQFPGHIACSSASKSEIVVPIRRNGKVIAVLDIDSADYNTFDRIDQTYLEQIAALL